MSRRREAAELAIALSLSTQEANRITDIPSPYRFSLSSGNTTQTQDSKEMELRPYLPPDGVGSNDVHTGTGVGMGYEYGGLPPIVAIVRPEDVMKAPNPSNSESIHGSSGSGSGKGTSSAYNTSIQSFPSPSVPPRQAINPPTNSGHRSGTIHPTSSGSSNPPVPTSFPQRSSNNNNIASPAWSSPIPPNANVPSHVSSTELSSNRPLFSSTQGSAIPPPITPDAHPRPSVIKTYGKAASSGHTPSPEKNLIVLSCPPVRGGSMSPTKKRKNIVLSDDSDEEEEPIEFRTPLPIHPSKGPTPKSRVEVILPTSRPSSASANKTHDTRPSSNQESGRHHSPDPLDSLNGSGQSPMKGINQPSSSAISAMTNGSSRRVSSRVAENKAKELAEKEERRRKRREEKEKKRLEEEVKDNKGKSKSPVKDKSPMKDEDKSLISEKGSMVEPIEIEESLEMEVQIDNPPRPPAKSDPIETRGKKRKSDVEIPIIDQNDQDEDFNPSSSRKGKKAKKGKKEPVKKGKAAQKKVVEPEPEPEQEPEPEKIVETTDQNMEEDPAEEEKGEEPENPPKSPTPPPPPPTKSVSPARPPLRATSSNVSTPSASSINHRPSPGPITKDGTPSAPGGIRWKAPRNDLTSVLAKFGGAKRSGLTKKLRIAPLHQKIGPPAKALPPVPKKAEKKKSASDDEDDEDDEDEDGQKKVGKGTMEWFMVED
ncbi:hypothetical protein L486_04537 [Kwoniella mangroviensis CBS 10435]|uniref:Uncharacterized protein n=1 Tax=Kwoniella mangroviensis CBS 10435 TaxID=1331196 RepID=A0A1B9ISX7_9TREE|nr:hypothetical protein L486_04537 [Kwoniella mangroviensis CBS 10435]